LVSELARATPPNFPRATAFGFFFVAMPCIISLSAKLVKKELLKFSAFPTTPLTLGFPTQTGHSDPVERMAVDRKHGLASVP
jgi:hypothetical protein